MLTEAENLRLSSTGPGTPVGELLRRYWHPVAAISEFREHPTKQVKILGEELVLFKNERGEFGLVGRYCAHRGVNLVYGIPDGEGIRCPYHGWKYDRAGACVNVPFEHTLRPDRKFDNIKLAGYPVQQLGGLIFAYLGPKPEPLLPRWDLLIEENVWREVGHAVTPCNWLQTVENILDPVHVEWLHGEFRNYAAKRTGRVERQRKRIRHVKIGFDLGEYGIIKRRILEGETEESDDWKIGHWLVFPNVQKGPDMLRFRVPVDDAHTAQWYFSVHPLNEGESQGAEQIPLYEMPSPVLAEGALPEWSFLDGDVDVQDNAIFESQGKLFDRRRENLLDSDRGIVMYRHLLDAQIKTVQEGGDPMNVFRDPERNQCLSLATESREHFLTGRLGARTRYSQRYRSLVQKDLQ